jgi:hypothetical protein
VRLSTVARLGVTGIAMGIASYIPLASSVPATPASATGFSFFFFPCAPHGHEMLFCEGSSISSDVAIKENIVAVVW